MGGCTRLRRAVGQAAHSIDELHRPNNIASRLGHLDAKLVDDEAVRDHAGKRSGGARLARALGLSTRDPRQKRRLEPSAVLVRALKVDVGHRRSGRLWRCQAPPSSKGCPRAARVEPHVEGVSAAHPQRRLVRPAWRKQLGCGQCPPRVGAVQFDEVGDMRNRLGCQQHLTCADVVEGGQWHAPWPLTREAPFGAALDEGLKPRPSRRGYHVHVS
mmetsp:Transcript_18938/g.57218  ORF Transcript_18938/g.57218 Transcript_18938/m.57218 type:complete len:215 (-) Transcript_18938:432-1076(-)